MRWATFIFSAWVLLFQATRGTASESTIKLVPGIIKVPYKFPNPPIMYDTYFAMLFEYELPSYDFQSFNLSPDHCPNCPGSFGFCNYKQYGGPVTTHLVHNAISDKLIPALDPLKGLPIQSNFKIQQNFSQMPGFCDEIQPSFTQFNSTSNELESYTQALASCEFGSSKVTRLKVTDTDYDSDLKNYYINIMDETRKAIYPKPASTYSSSSGIYPYSSRSYYSSRRYGTSSTSSTSSDTKSMVIDHLLFEFQTYTLFLINRQAESQRWKDAIASCIAGKIPYTILPEDILRPQLNAMTAKLGGKGYSLAVPLDQLMQYYKLPLADCTFVGKQKLLVRVLIPVKKQVTLYEFVQLKPMRFASIEKESDKICFISLFGNSVYRQTKWPDKLTELKCVPGQLCRVADSEPLLINPCSTGFQHSSPGEIPNQCDLQCIKMKPTSPPVFDAVSSDTVVVVRGSSGYPTGHIFVTCNQIPTIIITPVDVGALELVLPCGCHLFYNMIKVFESTQPCVYRGNYVLQSHIMPAAWQNMGNNISSLKMSAAPSTLTSTTSRYIEPTTYHRPDSPIEFVKNCTDLKPNLNEKLLDLLPKSSPIPFVKARTLNLATPEFNLRCNCSNPTPAAPHHGFSVGLFIFVLTQSVVVLVLAWLVLNMLKLKQIKTDSKQEEKPRAYDAESCKMIEL